MASKVYFADLRAKTPQENTISKIQRLFDEAGFVELLGAEDLTAIKIHFGEYGNDGYINPVFVRQVVDKIRTAGAKPFITDTNTLYSGSRHNAVDHLTTAIEHGFDYSVVRAPLIISDGLRSQNAVDVEIGQKHFNSVKIGSDIAAADSMIVMSHLKGHIVAGFGGAIKNLAMGCAPAAGKKEQHFRTSPHVVEEKCVACGECVEICPVGASSLVGEVSMIEPDICISCGQCMEVCPSSAIDIDWENDIPEFLECLTEYAYGAVKGKEGRVGYINFLLKITPDCDCVPWSDAPIVPDIGILASTDPVALDQASYDLVNRQKGLVSSSLHFNHEAGADKFRGISPMVDGTHQLKYGEKIGLGSREYKLVEI
ncbi:MAG: DUF362 domain-containing protein [Methanosarcina sp.]|nr:DUF362 domain-containing protein [Methanosarcina sp.]MDD4306968.1 DUF362 domain-containing protein [Methanosarcina sp.]MDD4621586.1 DUF362 domain-containing protein [Methanosarcina sp.]NLN44819.1 DUF362 domain-containing protein [Methanosarcina sp.]